MQAVEFYANGNILIPDEFYILTKDQLIQILIGYYNSKSSNFNSFTEMCENTFQNIEHLKITK